MRIANELFSLCICLACGIALPIALLVLQMIGWIDIREVMKGMPFALYLFYFTMLGVVAIATKSMHAYSRKLCLLLKDRPSGFSGDSMD